MRLFDNSITLSPYVGKFKDFDTMFFSKLHGIDPRLQHKAHQFLFKQTEKKQVDDFLIVVDTMSIHHALTDDSVNSLLDLTNKLSDQNEYTLLFLNIIIEKISVWFDLIDINWALDADLIHLSAIVNCIDLSPELRTEKNFKAILQYECEGNSLIELRRGLVKLYRNNQLSQEKFNELVDTSLLVSYKG